MLQFQQRIRRPQVVTSECKLRLARKHHPTYLVPSGNAVLTPSRAELSLSLISEELPVALGLYGSVEKSSDITAP